MPYGLYRKSTGGTIRKIKGNPRSPINQRNLIVWDSNRGDVKAWINEFGTKTQKNKHLTRTGRIAAPIRKRKMAKKKLFSLGLRKR